MKRCQFSYKTLGQHIILDACNHEAYAHCLLYASLMWGRKQGGDPYDA